MTDISMAELVLNEKAILPSFYGGDDIRRTYATIIDLWRAGRIDLEWMITHHVPRRTSMRRSARCTPARRCARSSTSPE